MFCLGTVSADTFSVGRFAAGLAMVLCGQLTAHYLNEYADLEADRSVQNRTAFSGGSGVLVEGALRPSTALRAGILTSVATVTLAAGLASFGRPWAAALGLVALAVSWSYSMPPIRLLGTPVGEAAAGAVVVVLVPAIGALVQDTPITYELMWAMAVLFPLHLAMMLAFEIPDLESDARAGKRVMAVRLGRQRTLRLILGADLLTASVVVMALAANALSVSAGWTLTYGAPAFASLWGLSQRRYQISSASAVLAFGVAALALTFSVGTGP